MNKTSFKLLFLMSFSCVAHKDYVISPLTFTFNEKIYTIPNPSWANVTITEKKENNIYRAGTKNERSKYTLLKKYASSQEIAQRMAYSLCYRETKKNNFAVFIFEHVNTISEK